MIENELILIDLQEKLRSAENEETKMILNELIFNISGGKYAVRIW